MGRDTKRPTTRLDCRIAVSTARQLRGQEAETLACDFLIRQGLELVERNYRRRLGELDLVLRERDTLVIVEVRTRARSDYGGAAASVDGWKRRRLVRAAQQLLQQRRELARMPSRFDVVVVHGVGTEAPRVEWIRHAFEMG
jgi:putative endonuclease